jgi:hypothetical protein
MTGATRAGQNAQEGSRKQMASEWIRNQTSFDLGLLLTTPLSETTYRGDPVVLCVLQVEKVTTYTTLCIRLL